MVHHGLERLAVIAGSGSGELVGIVTRSDLLKPAGRYYEEEVLRERTRWWQGGQA
jgi:hypothetical protein